MNFRKIKNFTIKYACILTTGRTGSDYLQGCLDGVPGIITFSGELPFFKFLKDSQAIKFLKEKNLNKLIIYFIKKNKNLFFYDKMENKKFSFSIKKFKKFFFTFMKDKKLDNENFLKSIYLSYHLTLKRKIFKNNIIVHHSHNLYETEMFLQNFKNAKLLVTIRNPLHNLRSGIENWINFDKKRENFEHFYLYVRRIREDLNYALKKKRVFFVKLERMNETSFKKSILNFLKVNYSKKVDISTFAGKPWKSDKLSKFKRRDGKFNMSVLKRNLENFYYTKDLLVLRYLYNQYNLFGYKLNKLNIKEKIILPFLFFLPMKFEVRLLKNVFKENFKMFHVNFYYYLRKIFYYYRIYLF